MTNTALLFSYSSLANRKYRPFHSLFTPLSLPFNYPFTTMKHKFLATMAVMSGVLATSCKQDAQSSGNPLLEEPTAKYGIVDYDKITVDNFREAILKGMDEQKAEIEAIVNNTEEPTFQNTVAALDQSGQLLNKAALIFMDLADSNSTDEKKKKDR